MKFTLKGLLILSLSILIMDTFGQGTLKGIVLDELTGEALAGVNIINEEKHTGTATKSDGSFSLDLKAGNHMISMSMVGFVPQLTEVDIVDGEQTNMGRIPNASRGKSCTSM